MVILLIVSWLCNPGLDVDPHAKVLNGKSRERQRARGKLIWKERGKNETRKDIKVFISSIHVNIVTGCTE